MKDKGKEKEGKIKVLKNDPVARSLSEGQYRSQVRPSAKAYKRADNRKMARAWRKGQNDPMNSSVTTGGFLRSF